MTLIANKDFKVDMQLKAIELLSGSINYPTNPNLNITNFNFNISVESKADATNKLLFVIVGVEIRNDDQSFLLGSVQVSCIFNIINFDEVIKHNEEGKVEIDPTLVNVLNTISISTTRGVMFTTYKGTFLHNAILPIIDPNQIQSTQLLK